MNTATIQENAAVKEQVVRIQAFYLRNEFGEEAESAPKEPPPRCKSKLKWQYVAANRLAIPVVLKKEQGGYTATTPVLKGCIAEGDTIEESLQDFKRALKSLRKAYASERRDVPWSAPSPLRLRDPATRVFTVLI